MLSLRVKKTKSNLSLLTYLNTSLPSPWFDAFVSSAVPSALALYKLSRPNVNNSNTSHCQCRVADHAMTGWQLRQHIKPNTHCLCEVTQLSSWVALASAVCTEFATADGCVHTADTTQLHFAVGKFVQTRWDCRQLVWIPYTPPTWFNSTAESRRRCWSALGIILCLCCVAHQATTRLNSSHQNVAYITVRTVLILHFHTH